MTSKKLKTILWALFLWTLWTFFYALIMDIQIKEISYLVALISSANYNYIYALLTILIWWICKKISFEENLKIVFIALHFILANIFSAMWLFIVYSLWYFNAGEDIFKMVKASEIIGWQFLFGVTLYFLAAGIFYTIIYYKIFKQKQLIEAELKLLTRDAELKALKLQMNPHFLFNSLNSINALITKDPSQARVMISRLSELLRMSLETHEKVFIPLKEELELVNLYLEIEQIRFNDKMKYSEKIDTDLLVKQFPAMMLQPLLENAVKHGIANSTTGGEIELSIKKNDQYMQGVVCNKLLNKPVIKTVKNGHGTGIANIRQRLNRLYGDDYELEVNNLMALNSFEVRFKIPIQA